jgi:hypothetical protein
MDCKMDKGRERDEVFDAAIETIVVDMMDIPATTKVIPTFSYDAINRTMN